MKLPESQAKALEEAAEKYMNEHVEQNGGGSFFNKQEASSYSFQAGAHYQHPISYAQGIMDVIKIIRTHTKNGEKEIDYFLEGYFSTELKSLENGGKE